MILAGWERISAVMKHRLDAILSVDVSVSALCLSFAAPINSSTG